jgi:hypothetical protein
MVVKTANPDNISTSAYAMFYWLEISDAVLYVPVGSKTAYESADEWSSFGVIIEGTGPTGIKNIASDNIIINVNYQTGDINVKGFDEGAVLTIIDLNGKIILSKSITEDESISTSFLSKGIYVAKVSTQQGFITKKFVKK